jgi:hypothetical protein
MALPIRAPAATPPRMPAPTAQPTQSAFAGAGAIIAAMAMPTALTDAMSNLCMCFPPRVRSVPIRAVSLNPKGLLNRLVGVRAAPEKMPARAAGSGADVLSWPAQSAERPGKNNYHKDNRQDQGDGHASHETSICLTGARYRGARLLLPRNFAAL